MTLGQLGRLEKTFRYIIPFRHPEFTALFHTRRGVTLISSPGGRIGLCWGARRGAWLRSGAKEKSKWNTTMIDWPIGKFLKFIDFWFRIRFGLVIKCQALRLRMEAS